MLLGLSGTRLCDPLAFLDRIEFCSHGRRLRRKVARSTRQARFRRLGAVIGGPHAIIHFTQLLPGLSQLTLEGGLGVLRSSCRGLDLAQPVIQGLPFFL